MVVVSLFMRWTDVVSFYVLFVVVGFLVALVVNREPLKDIESSERQAGFSRRGSRLWARRLQHVPPMTYGFLLPVMLVCGLAILLGIADPSLVESLFVWPRSEE